MKVMAGVTRRWGGIEPLRPAIDRVARDKPLFDEMVKLAKQPAESDGDSSKAALDRAISLIIAELALTADRRELADEFFQQALERADQLDPSVLLAWGMQRLVVDQYAEAVAMFRKTLQRKLPPEQAGPIYFYLAAALAMGDQYDAALEAARESAQRMPDSPVIQQRPAWVLFLARRWSESHDAYMAFLKRFGDRHDDPEVRTSVRQAKSSLSTICVELGRPEEAESWLEQVLDEFPDDVGAQNDLGYLWADRSVHLERALRMILAAVKADPENPAYRDSYGWVLYRLGRHAEAVTELQRAADGSGSDGVILDHLGDALFQTAGHEAAVAVWQRALQQLGDTEPARREQIQRKLTSPR
jgi:tetratricopeptide (TPR) repeat protein